MFVVICYGHFYIEDKSINMPRKGWFRRIQSVFYEALDNHSLSEWYIVPMPSTVNTELRALKQGEQQGWPYRTHNAVGRFQCFECGRNWISAYTTVVWRARWSTGQIEMSIEEQDCQTCDRSCHGSIIDRDNVEFAADCMCLWILERFYGIVEERNDDDEGDANDEQLGGPPHDHHRCVAGMKGTCKKCKDIIREARRSRASGGQF